VRQSVRGSRRWPSRQYRDGLPRRACDLRKRDARRVRRSPPRSAPADPLPRVAAGANAATDQRLFHADGRARLWGCRRDGRERGAATLARWIFRSDQRNSTCDVYYVRSSCLAGARQSRSAMPPKCSWKPHCTMSVFVLLVFCLIGHPGRMPGSGRRRNDEPGRVSSERSRSCCPLARGSSQMGTGQGSLLAWQPGASLIAARFEPMPHARGVRPPYEDPSHGSGICSTR